MPKMKARLSSHNKGVLQKAGLGGDAKQDIKPCNCQKSRICPLDGACQTPSVVYQAKVEAPNKPIKIYVGMTERPFKTRLYEHTTTFNKKPKDGTALSKYIWELKDQNIAPQVTWEILKKAHPYKCGSGRCDLCTSEKLQILLSDPVKGLNVKSELVAKCRHRAKYKLNSVTR